MTYIFECDNTPMSKVVNEAVPNTLTRKEEMALDACQAISFACYKGYKDDKLLCVWGLIPPSVLSNEVYFWLHVTPNIEGNTFMFVRRAQIMLEEILKDYEAVVGKVDVNNPRNKKWLKMLGAKFGAQQGKFIPFRIERKWQ